MIRKIVHRGRAALLKQLGRGVAFAPHAMLAASDPIARLAFPRLDARLLARVFPEISRDTARQGDRWSRRLLMRNRLLTEAIRACGYHHRLSRLVLSQPLLPALIPPAILVTFHVGVLSMLGFALAQLSAEVLVISVNGDGPQHASLEHAAARVSEQQRALLFHRCVDFLRTGRFVFIAADPRPADRGALHAPFRGGSIKLSRGPFALARITGAPIIPLVARWRGASVEFILGDPVPPSGEEIVTAAAVAAWLDRYLTAAPLEISEHTLSLMT